MTDDSRSERPGQNREPDRRSVSAQGVFNRGPAPAKQADSDTADAADGTAAANAADGTAAADAADETGRNDTATDGGTSSERTSEAATDNVTAQGVFDRGGYLTD